MRRAHLFDKERRNLAAARQRHNPRCADHQRALLDQEHVEGANRRYLQRGVVDGIERPKNRRKSKGPSKGLSIRSGSSRGYVTSPRCAIAGSKKNAHRFIIPSTLANLFIGSLTFIALAVDRVSPHEQTPPHYPIPSVKGGG